MADDLADGFTPPGDETPTKYHIHRAVIEYDPEGGVSFELTWSYGKDDGSGGYLQIGRRRTAKWTGADVAGTVTDPNPGPVNTDLHSISDQLLVDGGYVAKGTP